jgi:hypothetical protein
LFSAYLGYKPFNLAFMNEIHVLRESLEIYRNQKLNIIIISDNDFNKAFIEQILEIDCTKYQNGDYVTVFVSTPSVYDYVCKLDDGKQELPFDLDKDFLKSCIHTL